MDKIFVLTGGISLIIFIYWFFFGKRQEAVVADEDLNIIVEGGYKPAVISLKKGEKVTLKVKRRDPSSCLEEIVLPDFKIKKYLPLNETVEIEVNPEQSGEFPFHCGMNMYHGKIVVK